MKKFISIILILGLVFSLFAGCAKEPAEVAPSASQSVEPSTPVDPAQGKTVAICMGSVSHPVHRIIQYGFLTKAEELGMEPIVSGLDDGSIAMLIDKWQSVVNNGAKGVAVYTGDDSAYELMRELKEEGIYTVVPHFAHSYEDTRGFIDRNVFSSSKEYTKKAVDYLVNELAKKSITEGNIIIGANWGGVEPSYEGWFNERVTEISVDFAPVLAYEGADDETAIQNCIDHIYNTPDLVAVFGTTGQSAYYWSTAAKRTGRTDIIILGVGFYEDNLDLIRNGDISGLICVPLKEEGEICAQTLYDLFNGKVFNNSEENWAVKIEAPIAYIGGEGLNGIEYYQNILNTSGTYFEE